MCGIIGAVAERNVVSILVEGLNRLQYRGYDSAGIAVLDNEGIQRVRVAGKVQALELASSAVRLAGHTGIAHTRWATHGAPTEENAHPHVSDELAVVHNGIIENHAELRDMLEGEGFVFSSQTDSEVVAHLIQFELRSNADLLCAIRSAASRLSGAYALAIICMRENRRIIAVRQGSPMVVGLGIGENFVCSDQLALQAVTNRFVYLEEGDIADVQQSGVHIFDQTGGMIEREVMTSTSDEGSADKGSFRHFMLKEIHEQPHALLRVMQGHVLMKQQIRPETFGAEAPAIFAMTEHVHIIACGSSFHAGLVARHWIEQMAAISCSVEVASEFRYGNGVLPPRTLVIAISQSGETADTLAALREARRRSFLASLAICNVASSALVREADLRFITRAGPEVGVASTKAFTAQLVALLMLAVSMGRARDTISAQEETNIVTELRELPQLLETVLSMDNDVRRVAEEFLPLRNAIFLGRGAHHPIALEGALKMKEISYIHAEGYPAGELKHGPLALIDLDMPVVALVPRNGLVDKLQSSLYEVRARGARLYVFTEKGVVLRTEAGVRLLVMPPIPAVLAPIVYTIPMQLLAYYVAVGKGIDVDQPRNLAKSVTVE